MNWFVLFPAAQNLSQTILKLVPGTNTLSVAATDFRTPPNTTTKAYNVVTSATGTSTLSYDLNGNLTSDGYRTFEWDAKNQLIAINYTGTTKRTEFVYDGLGRRVKIAEKDNGALTGLKVYVWVGDAIAEEQDGTFTTTKRYYSQGFVLSASGQSQVSYYYTRDHLGSTREVTDSNGAIHARYEYDPYGRVTKLSGDVDSDFLYTGHYYHSLSNLYLAKYRAYDPNTGRWLSRDPIEEAGGINLYAYVGNGPIDHLDLLGLELSPHDAERLGRYVNSDQIDSAIRGGYDAYGGTTGFPPTRLNAVIDHFAVEPRYGYSPTLGWIDLQHVAASLAIQDEFGLAMGDFLGFFNECSQGLNAYNPFRSQEERDMFKESAFAKEDLISNHLGTMYGLNDSLGVNDLVDQPTAHMLLNPADFMKMTSPLPRP